MTESTFCVTVNSKEKPKYRDSTSINNEFNMANSTVASNCVKNPMWSGPSNQFTPKTIKQPKNVFDYLFHYQKFYSIIYEYKFIIKLTLLFRILNRE